MSESHGTNCWDSCVAESFAGTSLYAERAFYLSLEGKTLVHSI